MENIFPVSAPENPAEMEAAIKRMFAEMELADERILRTQQEIDKLKAEIIAKREPVKAG